MLFPIEDMEPNVQQLQLFTLRPPKQFLKWIGNKQRYACQIANVLSDHQTYIEPFLGSGAILGTLAPTSGIAGDILEPLVGIWQLLQTDSESLLQHYTHIWKSYMQNRGQTYMQVLESYNASPNPYDLLFLCRSCYGGVVRFTKEGRMSTPVGI